VPVAYTLLDRLVVPKARQVRVGQPVEAD